METILTSPKSSALLGTQQTLNAQFSDVFGWTMARSYGDPVQEHQTVRERVGLIDLSYYGVIKVGGQEAVQFLNGLVTNDVKTMAAHQGMRAAFLTGHGKVRGLCRILSSQDSYLIINDPQT